MSNDQIQAATGIPTWQERTAFRQPFAMDAHQWEIHRAKDAEIADLRAQLARQGQEKPVGKAVAMPGSGGGFTMCAFNASDVPVGTEIYLAAPASAQAVLPEKLPDDVLRYAMECAGRNNPDGAREVKTIYLFLRDALLHPASAQPDRGAAQGEAFAWAVFADNGNVIIWSKRRDEVAPVAARYGKPIVPVIALEVAALHSQPVRGVPDGFVLAPVDPPVELVCAIELAIDSQLQASGISPIQMQRQDGYEIYAAMLAALPQGSQVGGQSTPCKFDGYGCGSVGPYCDKCDQPLSTAPEGADGMGGAA